MSVYILNDVDPTAAVTDLVHGAYADRYAGEAARGTASIGSFHFTVW